MNNIGIYDLNNLSFLENDIQDILTKINVLYSVDYKNNIYISKTRLSNGYHWTSDESNAIFNSLIPTVKTLTKDAYAIIETIHKDKLGKFDKSIIEGLEVQYTYFKEFRLLNNKFKHHNDTVAEINLTKIVLMDENGQFIDVYVNYKYTDKFNGILFFELLKLFLQILEDKKVIQINRIK